MKFDPDLFKQVPVLGIVRGLPESSLEGVLDSARDAGLKFLEITLNTDNALKLIQSANDKFGDFMCVGAGTVRNLAQAEQAVSSGAHFLVGPTLNEDVGAFCRKHSIPYFPGALTPAEIERAWLAEAYMVKVFPASQMGPKYFREIKGPFDEIPLMAVGGVQATNIPDYLSSGASAVAVGGSVFSESRMINREYSKIRNHLKEILFAVKNFLNTM
ncbi:MAG: bifunctional 4-hydroxy-2-oxoglutarate aldolase/2-dehydro-3-deoxy-phosphogluconate aldolase [Nitrospinota bacterium]|nr:bifunctional 4-hydroxy-2-oxoglutarate aldolase/2-dehydro-3-deoxy-phosphogluconate aldolase [Nitrospinota bacterium]